MLMMLDRLEGIQKSCEHIIAAYELSTNLSYDKIQMAFEHSILTTDTLSSIIEQIDLLALNSSIGGGLHTPALRDDLNSVIEQKVEIAASFPNVSDHNEIEQAFNNLVNQASQYANRNK